MKKFDAPHMTMVYLSREDIITTSPCNSNYCDGHVCDQCHSDDITCNVVTPCTAHTCGRVLCRTY